MITPPVPPLYNLYTRVATPSPPRTVAPVNDRFSPLSAAFSSPTIPPLYDYVAKSPLAPSKKDSVPFKPFKPFKPSNFVHSTIDYSLSEDSPSLSLPNVVSPAIASFSSSSKFPLASSSHRA
ncbi:hypothetical protein CPC08DRAFT_671268, partial [Agrocybe pediades]